MARLLAFGGTHFGERRRIGKWPEIPLGVFQELYDLPPGAITFGVGILEGQIFLVFRERQNVHNRGGYPYTLLLDPEDTMWVYFEWNAAALLVALRSISDIARVLFERPEDLSEPQLVDFLESTSKVPRPRFHLSLPSCADLAPLWAAAALDQIPRTVPCSQLGAAGRPDLHTMGAILESLPIPFRVGSGWLVGGGEVLGQCFGAKLVLDDHDIAGTHATLSVVIEDGQRVLEAWNTVREHDRKTRWLELLEAPPWKWLTQPQPALRNLHILAGLLSPDLLDKALSALLERPLPPDGPLGDHLMAEAVAACSEGTAPLAGIRTAFLLKACLDAGYEIARSSTSRLDPEGLRLILADLSIPPASIPETLPLSSAQILALYREYFASPDAEPARAVFELSTKRPAHLEDSHLRELAILALDSSLHRNEPLAHWTGPAAHPVVQEELSAILSRAAIDRARDRRNASWPLDYALFGNDPGGQRLVDISPQDASYCVARLISNRDDQAIGPLVCEWLNAAAGTEFRSHLDLTTKLNLLAPRHSSWWYLNQLKNLYYYGQALQQPSTPSRYERIHLHAELLQMTGDPPQTGPDIPGIITLLDYDVPEDTLRKLLQHCPNPASLDPPARARLFQAVKRTSHSDLYNSLRSAANRALASNVANQLYKTFRSSPNSCELIERDLMLLDAEAQEALTRYLLFVPQSPELNKQHAEVILGILKHDGSSPRGRSRPTDSPGCSIRHDFRSMLLTVFKTCIQAKAEVSTFALKYADYFAVLNGLFQILRPNDEAIVVAILDQVDPMRVLLMVAGALPHFRQATVGPIDLPHLYWALAEFMKEQRKRKSLEPEIQQLIRKVLPGGESQLRDALRRMEHARESQ